MKKFTASQTGALMLAINTLTLQEYIESYSMAEDHADFIFDDYTVRVIAPMDGALQFTLFDKKENIIKSVITDQVVHALPIRRLVLALISVILLDSFNAEWDGYFINETFVLRN